MNEKRKAFSIWLKPRYRQMLAEMPDISLPDIVRRSIEETFESRYDREYAKLCVEEDLVELADRWKRLLGLQTSFTTTATEDGFRIVLVSLKRYSDVEPERELPSMKPVPTEPEEIMKTIEDALDEWEED